MMSDDPLWSEVLSMEETLQPSLRALIKWLREPRVRAVVGETVPIPLETGEKRPMFAHRLGKWSWEELGRFLAQRDNDGKGPHDTWGLLLDRVCAIDADDAATITFIEARVQELASCPAQATSRGRHWLFSRPAWADADGFYDGSAQNKQHADAAVRALKVDFKSVTSHEGTRGVLQVSPSAGKEWLRPPWDWSAAPDAPPLPELPRHLAELVARSRSKKERVAADAVIWRDKLRKSKDLVALTAAERSTNPADAVAVAEKEHDKVVALLKSLSQDRWDTYKDWRWVGGGSVVAPPPFL